MSLSSSATIQSKVTLKEKVQGGKVTATWEGRFSENANKFSGVWRAKERNNAYFDPSECARIGKFVFKRTGKRQYYRLQQMVNTCSGQTDYIDVYLR